MKSAIHRILIWDALLLCFAGSMLAKGDAHRFLSDQGAHKSWSLVKEFDQKSFPKSVPPGNYSGITHLYDDVYAVVSDKSDSALYFNFRIQVNQETGELSRVEYLGFSEYIDSKCNNPMSQEANGTRIGYDHEAIAKVSDSTLVVASEGFCSLKEYPIFNSVAMGSDTLARKRQFWEWKVNSAVFYPNYNFESLAFDSLRRCLWTMPESTLRCDGVPATPQNGIANRLRLLCFDWGATGTYGKFHPLQAEYAYLMDKPSVKKKAQTYAMGVSELCTLPDGKLMVLEREAFVPKIKIGAFCRCKIYVVDPSSASPLPVLPASDSFGQGALEEKLNDSTLYLNKVLLAEWVTRLTLFDRSFANYEGMCLGPQLKDGSQVVILLSDSQNQYAGVLKDYFKTIVIR